MFMPVCFGNAPRSTQWRLMSSGVGYPGFFEIEMKDGGADQCSGGTASWQATFYSTPADCFDNDLATIGMAWGSPSWIQYTFPSAVAVSSLVLTGADGYTGTTIALEYYNGTAWETVKTWSGLSWTVGPETKTLTV